MTGETYELTVTLTASAVSARASGPEWDLEAATAEANELEDPIAQS